MLERRKKKLVEVVDRDSKKLYSFNDLYKHKELNRLAKVERKRLKKHRKKFKKAYRSA